MAPSSPRPDREHPGDAAGAEREPHRLAGAGLTGGVRRPDVGPHREPHPDVAGDRREPGAEDERDRPAEPDRRLRVLGVLRGRAGGRRGPPDDREEDADRAELAGQVGAGALLDRPGDLLHLLGAFGGFRTSRTRYQANSSATSEIPKMTHRAVFSNDPKTAIGPPSWARPAHEPPGRVFVGKDLRWTANGGQRERPGSEPTGHPTRRFDTASDARRRRRRRTTWPRAPARTDAARIPTLASAIEGGRRRPARR